MKIQRPKTEGGVWGSYVEYLKHLEALVEVWVPGDDMGSASTVVPASTTGSEQA